MIKVRATDENGKTVIATSDVVTVNPILAEEMATEKEVIEGKKFITGEGIIKTGTMENRGDLNKTVTAGGNLPLPAGYYDAGTITAPKDSNSGKMILIGSSNGNSTINITEKCTEYGIDPTKVTADDFYTRPTSTAETTIWSTLSFWNAKIHCNGGISYNSPNVTITQQIFAWGVDGNSAYATQSFFFACDVYLFVKG